MKAAVLVDLNQPLVVADLEMPKELAFGQVLVKVHYSGICGAQINEIGGRRGRTSFCRICSATKGRRRSSISGRA